jgi:hypothetical protein
MLDQIRTSSHMRITSDVVEVTAADVHVTGSLEHICQNTTVITLTPWTDKYDALVPF